jgi:hypothetical protein
MLVYSVGDRPGVQDVTEKSAFWAEIGSTWLGVREVSSNEICRIQYRAYASVGILDIHIVSLTLNLESSEERRFKELGRQFWYA